MTRAKRRERFSHERGIEPFRGGGRRHYAYRTEETYREWAERYLAQCRQRAWSPPAGSSVRAFLESLALEHQVTASTQNQALNALVFFFREGLGQELGELGEFAHARKPRKLPVVLRAEEVARLLAAMNDPYRLMAELKSTRT